jgi:aminoglycoside/choline kinase family phosphotransferase
VVDDVPGVNETRVIADRSEITAAWLTAALQETDALPEGAIASLSVTRLRSKALSDLYQLQVTYTEPVATPTRFVLKLARRDAISSTANRRRWKEHEFYAQVAPVMDNPPIPQPYVAAYDPRAQRSHLLLADLTSTHWGTPAPLPPTPDQLRGDVDCLAAIHAVWWEHPDLIPAATERDETWIAAKTAGTQRRLEEFLAEFGAYLPAAIVSALETVAAAWSTILQRSAVMPLTVVHGDAHPWNFLTPLATDTGRTCLLDWEGWSIEPGPHDLASLIALHLPVSERCMWEDELLERYIGRLREGGVVSYDLTRARDDYRRAVARRVLSPVGLWSRGTEARSWWPALEHITAAYHDLRCEEVL